MADKRDRIYNLHDQMPAVFNTRINETWKAIVEALGEADQNTLDLIEGVREQFFLKTAARPYIDRIGTASLVQRPRFVGMEDTDFRKFIPVMSYEPKQVKIVLDKLLDLFFFQESTTAFIATQQASPFVLQDGWELEYEVDSFSEERIEFRAQEFTDISQATANEVVAAINRQATNSFAIAFEDSLTREVTIRIFTNTVGSKGAVQITGGRANIGLKFEGYNFEAGQGVGSQYQVSKIGDTVSLRFTNVGGSPSFDKLQAGDVVMINRPGNEGSFTITSVDPVSNTIKYENLFATEEIFFQSPANDVKFFTPYKDNIYLRDRKAAVWEIKPGEIIVEMPPSPPVVKRKRVGSTHINGTDVPVTNMIDRNTVEVSNASNFPESGRFFFVPKNEIQTFFPNEGDTTIYQFNSKFSSCLPTYTYTSINGNIIEGIQPDLPPIAGISEVDLVSAIRDSNNIITVITVSPHGYEVGNTAVIADAVQGAGTGASTNGGWTVTEIVSDTEFKCYSFSGPLGFRESFGGTSRVERAGISNTGSRVILSTAIEQPRRLGPYMWDENSDFVLSGLTTNLTSEVQAGVTQRNVQVEPNDILDQEGRLIFDFGTEKQEGPVRYFFKPNDTSLAIDPSYVFKFTHDVGSSVTMIRRRGGVIFSGLGIEYGAYITDPAAAREVLQELMQEVKSVGIFINFLIRYPQFFYATIDVYRSGVDPG